MALVFRSKSWGPAFELSATDKTALAGILSRHGIAIADATQFHVASEEIADGKVVLCGRVEAHRKQVVAAGVVPSGVLEIINE